MGGGRTENSTWRQKWGRKSDFLSDFPILGKFGGKTQQNVDLFNKRGGRKRNFLQLTGEEKWMDFGYIHLQPPFLKGWLAFFGRKTLWGGGVGIMFSKEGTLKKGNGT